MDIAHKCNSILEGYENIAFAFFFGSFVKGNFGIDSDIDIAIYVDNDFGVDDYLELKLELTEACQREIDLVILNDATPLLKHRVLGNNILIFSRDKSKENSFKVRTIFEYNDMSKYLELDYSKTIDRLRKEVEVKGKIPKHRGCCNLQKNGRS